MTSFAASRTTLGPHELVVLHDHQRDRHVRIARRGATVLNIEVSVNGALLDLAAGYRDAGELDTRPGSRFAIMLPFANRIADARYSFDGQPQDLQPGVPPAQRASRHGFVRGTDFEIAELGADADGAYVTMATDSIRPGVYPGYPHALDLAVRYRLQADGLALEVHMRNVGDEAAPCFFGWHPYFRLGDTPVDSWELQVPATDTIRTDAQSIPLPGASANVPLAQAPDLDYRKPRAIGTQKLDNGFAGLVPDADGRIRTHMRDPASGVGVAMWQEHGIALVFSADTVSRDVRRAVALEPMESYADAFNRPDCAAAIRLEAGAERRYRCGVEFLLP
jgi:aldose 1-epimerase